MILIFSKSNDISTDDVQIWMNYLGIKNVRLNEDYFISSFEISKDSCELVYQNFKLDLDKFSGFYYRRPGGTVPLLTANNITQATYNNYLIEYEYKTIYEFLDKKIKAKTHLNSIFDYKHQKLEYLFEASNIGLNVPEWIIASDTAKIKKFLAEKGRVITKALNMPYFRIPSENGETEFAYSTNEITLKDIESVETKTNKTNLFPTFFQEYVDKKFEVRSFCLNSKFYSMAIFSQQSDQTKIDYRKYNREKPNRAVPFNLPLEIEEKALNLVNKFKLNSCSIDFIYSTDNKFYFLEINPIGQFKWVSQNCNYYIEKETAEYFYERK